MQLDIILNPSKKISLDPNQPSVGRFMNMRYKNYLEYCNEV